MKMRVVSCTRLANKYKAFYFCITLISLAIFILIQHSHINEPSNETPVRITEVSECYLHILKASQEIHHHLYLDYITHPRALYRTLTQPFDFSKLPPLCYRHFLDKQKVKKNIPSCFDRALSEEFKRVYIQPILKVIKDEFYRNSIELILSSGSLVGSWRNHGIIPYDDDIDFRCQHSDRQRVAKLLRQIAARETRLRLVAKAQTNMGHMKLGVACTDLKTIFSCKLQIDFFFNKKAKDGWALSESPYFIPQEMLYPLQFRPFEGEVFLTFNNFKKFFNHWYGRNTKLDTCEHILLFRNQRKDKCLGTKIECSAFQQYYPYAKQHYFPKFGLVEFLVNQTNIVAAFLSPHNFVF